MKIRFFSPADNEPVPDGEPMPTFLQYNQFRAWSESERQYLRDNWQTKTNVELAQALNRTRGSIQSMGYDLGLQRTPEARTLVLSKMWNKKGKDGKELAWSEAELKFLCDNWQTMSTRELSKALGRTHGSVKAKGQRDLKLRKTQDALRAIAKRPNAGQFQKGSIAPNTILDEDMPIRIRHNHKDRGSRAYKWIRIAWRKWVQYHVWIWEQANGPTPAGMMIVFKNKDTMDVRLDNLEMISLKENVLRNSGSLSLSDGYVAHTLAWHNPDLQHEILKHPELIKLKRAELQLRRAIKKHDNAEPTETR